ncbi:MAG: AAA family ATPase [Hyphomonadaceae bacterium]|nr:AAA family ATPase [Hyphomonadaceae bacterium]
MSLVIIIGPPAVGKMTVGLELERLTGLKLFHNHMSIDLAARFFEPSSNSFGRVVGTIRRVVMEEVAGSQLKGLIFTYVWNFRDPRDAAAIQRCVEIFAAHGRQTYYVELEADITEREKRNTSELRLAHKPSKRDTEASLAQLRRLHEQHKTNSTNELSDRDYFLRINNTNTPPAEAAALIQRTFDLPRVSA